MPSPISVLVVDDSAFMRKMVTEMLSEDPALCVVGQARDGADALRQLARLQPDVVTLDVEMPVMDGLAALEQIMQQRPTPTIMLSSLTQAGADMTLRCLERGAVDFVGKPSGSISLDIRAVAVDLIAKIKAVAGVRTGRLTRRLEGLGTAPLDRAIPPVGPQVVRPSSPSFTAKGHISAPSLLVIGASTGGPRALQTLVPSLPADLGVPVVIIQHMPAGFTTSLARRLNAESQIAVREAADGDTLEVGVALLAPGGRHLQFDAAGKARLTNEPPVHGVRPSIDVTLASLTKTYGARTVAVLLTGMGKDGARGMKAVRDQGGITLAEDESTCVIYGMPKAAVDIGAVEHLLPLPQIADAITQILKEAKKSTR
jgi:two-component system chemotaxis response regulator CheB